MVGENMKEVNEYINSLKLKNQNIVVAVSGGVDSMVLLSLLNDKKKLFNYNVVCAHVNHNIRKESVDEAKMVKKYCEENNIMFEHYLIEDYNNENFQSEARKKRYCFFEKILSKYNSSFLFTAHHGDDLVETIILKILRGSTLKGYAGINLEEKREKYSIYRPLLFVDKDVVEKYAITSSISYMTDQSNFKDNYQRNRIRHNILPLLKKENVNASAQFLKYSERLIRADDYINSIVEEKYKKYITEKKTLSLDVQNEADIIMENIVIKYLFETKKELIAEFNTKHLELIVKMIKNDTLYQKIDLPKNNCLVKRYEEIFFQTEVIVEEYNYEIKDKPIKLPNNKVINKVDSSDKKSNFVIYIKSEEIELPLFVKNNIDKEYIYVKGLNGKKRVKDIFVNEKVPLEERKNYPIVVDYRGTVVWIPGLKKSYLDKTNEKKCDIILEYS